MTQGVRLPSTLDAYHVTQRAAYLDSVTVKHSVNGETVEVVTVMVGDLEQKALRASCEENEQSATLIHKHLPAKLPRTEMLYFFTTCSVVCVSFVSDRFLELCFTMLRKRHGWSTHIRHDDFHDLLRCGDVQLNEPPSLAVLPIQIEKLK